MRRLALCAPQQLWALESPNQKNSSHQEPGREEKSGPPKEKVSLQPTALCQKHFARGIRGKEREERGGERKKKGRKRQSEEERPLPVPVEAGESVPPSPPAWKLTHFS